MGLILTALNNLDTKMKQIEVSLKRIEGSTGALARKTIILANGQRGSGPFQEVPFLDGTLPSVAIVAPAANPRAALPPLLTLHDFSTISSADAGSYLVLHGEAPGEDDTVARRRALATLLGCFRSLFFSIDTGWLWWQSPTSDFLDPIVCLDECNVNWVLGIILQHLRANLQLNNHVPFGKILPKLVAKADALRIRGDATVDTPRGGHYTCTCLCLFKRYRVRLIPIKTEARAALCAAQPRRRRRSLACHHPPPLQGFKRKSGKNATSTPSNKKRKLKGKCRARERTEAAKADPARHQCFSWPAGPADSCRDGRSTAGIQHRTSPGTIAEPRSSQTAVPHDSGVWMLRILRSRKRNRKSQTRGFTFARNVHKSTISPYLGLQRDIFLLTGPPRLPGAPPLTRYGSDQCVRNIQIGGPKNAKLRQTTGKRV
ncbi:hypothetical protein DFH06DRAFT_1389410 [Mycena polygramma]|nr:hypothetical protein DFH06DRAFT_1389410 [Mycena polygramma]